VRRGPAFAAVLAAALAVPAVADAPATPDLVRQAQDLDAQLRFVEREYFRPDVSEGQRAHRKFSESEVQFLLQNWRSAIVLIYDAIDVPDFRASADYPTALYYLGESLYQEGEYRTARNYFHQLLGIPGAPRRREALLRALDTQRAGAGFSFVEILTMCPTGWFVETAEAPRYLAERLGTVHVSGVLKDVRGEDGAAR